MAAAGRGLDASVVFPTGLCGPGDLNGPLTGFVADCAGGRVPAGVAGTFDMVDVRDADEFRTGHIAGAVNIPLKDLAKTELPKNTPLFVYCLTGMRSRRGATILKKSGFTNVRDIGAMNAYEGKKER